MMFYDMTAQYQAERVKSAGEQRRTDAQAGMLAAEVSRLRQRLSRPGRILRGFGARHARTALYSR